MDNEQAKFILQSFRPDGADAEGTEFAEALALAVADRELGEWLARERAADTAFALMLNEVEIPEGLREGIFSVLATEAGDPNFDEADAVFVGALASIAPPADLRAQILLAMTAQGQDAKVVTPTTFGRSRVSKWLTSAAIAAAVVLGAFVALTVSPDRVSPELVESSAVGYLTQAGFSLDERSAEHAPIRQWLGDNKLPTPGVLPAGLESAPSIGCKKLVIGNKPASLICFRRTEGVVHLVVINLKDIDADLPTLDSADCHGCRKSGWAVASWREGKQALFLLGKMEPAALSKVLF